MEIPEVLPPLPTIPSANETLGEPPPSPPSPEIQAPPPESTKSPPPPTVVQPPRSPPTRPVPSPKLEPPPSSEEPNEPPPIQSPPAPPLEVMPSLSPPPPKQAVPPPSPESNSSLTLSPPQPSSPSPPSDKSDPQPHSPPTNPSGRLAPPPSNSSSLVFPSSPPPTPLDSSPIILSPPIPGPPTPPAETIDSPVPGTPAPSLPTPTSPESSSPVTDPLLTPVGPEIPSPSTPPKERTTNKTQSLTPPRQSGSASGTPASKESLGSSSNFRHAAIGIAVVGLFVGLFAICFLVSRKKRKRSEGLAVHYKPPSSYSVKSDGYYYRQANMTNSTQFETESAFKPSPFPSSTGMFGSQVDHLSYSGTPESVVLGNSKSYFTLEEITEITRRFARQNLLGEGGFGCVYKGWLADGRVVAVKQLKAGSGQGEREFRAEVEIISRVHHRHLVSLVGYCISEQHRSLVYEFVPNNTLEHHLHGKGLAVMDWPKRVKIAIGSARGLAYLHEDCHPRIIHRDIKSANILLDDSFEAQVADFGLAKLSNDINTHVSTRVMGTFGYMAPEYASSGKLTDRSDVFSFGVVLLEIITGRKPVDPSQSLGEESLVEWARPRLNHVLESWNFEEVVDPCLENNYVKSEMFKMMEAAAACVRHSGPKRPRMAQVLRALDYDGDLPDLSNGVKFGQSTAFDSRQYSADIQQFRRMAFGSSSYSSDRTYTEEFDNTTTRSGEYSFTETASWPLNAGRQISGDYQSSREYAPRSKSRRDSDCSSGSCRYNGRGLH